MVQGRPQRAQELPRLTHEPPRSMFGMAKIGTPSRREASFHKNALCHLDRFDHRFRVVLDTILGFPGLAFGGPTAANSGLGTVQERPNAGRGQAQTWPRAALVGQEQPKRPRGSSRKVEEALEKPICLCFKNIFRFSKFETLVKYEKSALSHR